MKKFILIFCIFININSKSLIDYSYKEKTQIPIVAGELTSSKQVIPYSYKNLKICNFTSLKQEEDTLGEILTGYEKLTTEYIVNLNVNKYCDNICGQVYNQNQISKIKELINAKYRATYYIDKLPAGYIKFNITTNKTKIIYNKGIPIGYKDENNYYIYNHLQFHIILNKISENTFNIVGFAIKPFSIKHHPDQTLCAKKGEDVLQNFEQEKQLLTEEESITFTYDVVFEYSKKTLATRWDNYKPLKRKKIHWINILITYISILIATFLIGYIIKKIINRDIDNYNESDSKLKIMDEYDWRKLSGDIFRSPSKNPIYLSSLLGIGTQLFVMCFIVLILGSLGFINPEKRVNVLTVILSSFCGLGLLSGYISSKFYKLFGGKKWVLSSIITALLFPGIFFIEYLIINIILQIEKSNAAADVYDILSLFILYFFSTFPLILIGSFLGFKTKNISIPCEVNKIPSYIPKKKWYLHSKFAVFLTGLLGFLSIVVEMEFAMPSLWRKEIYFMVSFLCISFILFIIYMSEIALLFIYFNLCKNDYLWWWKSFFIGASPIIYFIIYSIYYFFRLKITRFSSIVVYFGVMTLIATISSIITGTASTLISFSFIKYIYHKVLIDEESFD